MKLTVKGYDGPNIEFSLTQGDEDINILANGDCVAYFCLENDKIRLAVLKPDFPEKFHVNKEGYLEAK